MPKSSAWNEFSPFVNSSLKCFPPPIGVIFLSVTPYTPKTGSGFPLPNGSKSSNASARSIVSAEGLSLQSSFKTGAVYGSEYAYSFISFLNASILSDLRLTPAANSWPPNFVKQPEAYSIALKSEKPSMLLPEPPAFSPSRDIITDGLP